MLIRTSSELDHGLYLIKFGESCHYLIHEDSGLTLIDPGLSAHVQLLPERFAQLGVKESSISKVLLTHLHPERCAGIPLLRRLNPQVQVYATPQMRGILSQKSFIQELYEEDCASLKYFNLDSKQVHADFEEYVSFWNNISTLGDGELLTLGPTHTLRVTAIPGHSKESIGYLIPSCKFLIADEGFGYYNGQEFAAPGGDYDLKLAQSSIKKFLDIDLQGLGLPSRGALTGQLLTRHIQAVIQNTDDLLIESAKAFKAQFSDEEILKSINDAFFSSEKSDPVVAKSMKRTLDSVWKQIKPTATSPI